MFGRVSHSFDYAEFPKLYEAGELRHPDACIGDRPGMPPRMPLINPLARESISTVRVLMTEASLDLKSGEQSQAIFSGLQLLGRQLSNTTTLIPYNSRGFSGFTAPRSPRNRV